MLNTEMVMAEAFRQVAEPRKDQEALVCGKVRATYGQLLERAGGLARGLHQLGLRKGDRVIALLPPGPEFVYLFFAVAELGAVIVPLNPRTRRRRLSEVLRDAEPVALVTSRLVEDEALHQAASLRHVIRVGGKVEGSPSLADLISTGGTAPPQCDISPGDLLALLYTSGTTGTPKGTMHSHRSLIAPVVSSLKVRELWTRRPSLKTLGQSIKALARYRERLLRAAGRPQTFFQPSGGTRSPDWRWCSRRS